MYEGELCRHNTAIQIPSVSESNDGFCEGGLYFGPALQVAVRNLVFSGRLHIVLTPLLNSLPVIGAVQVSRSLPTI